jgi:hypothetical protein
MITSVKLITTVTSLTNPYTSKLIHGLGLIFRFNNLFRRGNVFMRCTATLI